MAIKHHQSHAEGGQHRSNDQSSGGFHIAYEDEGDDGRKKWGRADYERHVGNIVDSDSDVLGDEIH